MCVSVHEYECYVHECASIQVQICVSVSANELMDLEVCTCTCVCVYVCICVCMRMCACCCCIQHYFSPVHCQVKNLIKTVETIKIKIYSGDI